MVFVLDKNMISDTILAMEAKDGITITISKRGGGLTSSLAITLLPQRTRPYFFIEVEDGEKYGMDKCL